MNRAVMLTVMLVAAACGRGEPPPATPPVLQVETASTAPVVMRHVATGPRLSGTLEPQQSATIIAETGGTVIGVSVSEGQPVSAGATLARIADDSALDLLRAAEVAVRSAETAVAMARRDHERASRLEAAGALAQRDVEVGRAQVAAAEAQLGQARAQLAGAQERVGNQSITASVSGIVSEKRVSTGDVVSQGAPLFTIVDLRTLQLEANIPADAIAQVHPGAPVALEVRGYPGEVVRGTVSRISPAVDPGTGQIRIYVAVANQGKRLVAGLFAEGTVSTVSRQGLTIPIDALDESANTPAVSRVRNGLTERVTVRLGVRNEAEGWVEVLSGVDAGDTVLVGPSRTIAPGTRVNVS